MDEPVFTMTCVVGEEEALRRLQGGGVVTLSHPSPDVNASATIRGIGNGHGASLSYEMTLYPEDVTLNDQIMHLRLNGVLLLALRHIFAP